MKKFFTLLLTISLLLPAFIAFADTGNGTFTAPLFRENKDPLPLSDIKGFQVYIDGIKDNQINPDTKTTLLPNTSTAFNVTVNKPETEIKLTTIDTDGRESVFSEAIFVAGGSNPNAPLIIQITISIKGVSGG